LRKLRTFFTALQIPVNRSHALKVFAVIFFFSLSSINSISAQYVYKTPFGERYHRYTCSSVKNVSEKIGLQKARQEYGLTPCKRCDPPTDNSTISPFERRDKSQGECAKVRCQGWAKTQKRQCKRTTTICNKFCFQHQRS